MEDYDSKGIFSTRMPNSTKVKAREGNHIGPVPIGALTHSQLLTQYRSCRDIIDEALAKLKAAADERPDMPVAVELDAGLKVSGGYYACKDGPDRNQRVLYIHGTSYRDVLKPYLDDLKQQHHLSKHARRLETRTSNASQNEYTGISYPIVRDSYGLSEIKFEIKNKIQEMQRLGVSTQEDGSYPLEIDGKQITARLMGINERVQIVKSDMDTLHELIAQRNENHPHSCRNLPKGQSR